MGHRTYRSFEDRYEQVLHFTVDYLLHYNMSPSYGDIKKATGLKGDGHISVIINKIVEDGKLEREDGVARGLKLPHSFYLNTFPISMEGHIAADNETPLIVFDDPDPDSVIGISPELMPRGVKTSELYALRVKGDSMNAALIADGDIVILRRGDLWNDGDIVAIWLKNDDAVTLKKLYRAEYDVLTLKPKSHNPRHRARPENQNDIKVMGRVVAVMRKCGQQSEYNKKI